jgi:hypothetical protein
MLQFTSWYPPLCATRLVFIQSGWVTHPRSAGCPVYWPSGNVHQASHCPTSVGSYTPAQSAPQSGWYLCTPIPAHSPTISLDSLYIELVAADFIDLSSSKAAERLPGCGLSLGNQDLQKYLSCCTHLVPCMGDNLPPRAQLRM